MVMTAGHPNCAYGVKWYYSVVRGKLIGRIPGVNRTSPAVLARNDRMRANPPAAKCKGRPYREFCRCLSEQMKML